MARIRRTFTAALCLPLVAFGVWLGVTINTRTVEAFTLAHCHDDSSISRSNTHGSPNNGSFGTPGAAPNHSNAYYYLNINAAGCVQSVDGLIHVVGRVTANGTGRLPGCTASSSWGPPCDSRFRAVSGAAMVNERPAWGFEYKNAATGAIIACTGGDGSGGTNCPGKPNITAIPGNATVEFRYNGTVAGLRFRIANEYDDPIWEYAALDAVACSTCEPAR